jgi:hypothetical protein
MCISETDAGCCDGCREALIKVLHTGCQVRKRCTHLLRHCWQLAKRIASLLAEPTRVHSSVPASVSAMRPIQRLSHIQQDCRRWSTLQDLVVHKLRCPSGISWTYTFADPAAYFDTVNFLRGVLLWRSISDVIPPVRSKFHANVTAFAAFRGPGCVPRSRETRAGRQGDAHVTKLCPN